MALILDTQTDFEGNDVEISMANAAGIDFKRALGRTPQTAIDVVQGRRPVDCLNPQVFE